MKLRIEPLKGKIDLEPSVLSVGEVLAGKDPPNVEPLSKLVSLTGRASEGLADVTEKPGIVEMDLSILDGLSGNATVIGDLKGSSGSDAPSSARNDVSSAK